MIRTWPAQAMRTAVRTAKIGVKYAWSRINDLYLNIDTSDLVRDVDPERGFPYAKPGRAQLAHDDALVYQGADYLNIRRLIRRLRPRHDDVFFDIGCGKGRCLCMFARLPLHAVVGIELNASLGEVARQNAVRLRGKRTPIEVRCGDAATADYSDGTIYFLYNPFGSETLRDVLDAIKASISAQPRRITIVYYNAAIVHYLHECRWLTQTDQFRTLTGQPVSVFVNRSMAA